MLPLTVEDRLLALRYGLAFVRSYALGQAVAEECPSQQAWCGLAEHCEHMLGHLHALQAPLVDVLSEDALGTEQADDAEDNDEDYEDEGLGDVEDDDDGDVVPTRDQEKPRRLRGRSTRG